MITQKFNIYLHAGIAFAPVVHCSQYSQGETWTFTILDNDGSVYRPSSGALIGVKSDGNVIAGITGTVNSDGSVSIVTIQQLTAAAGRGIFELTIDGGTNGTANFIVEVEPKPTDGGVLSESDLSIIQQGINSVTPAVITETVSDYLSEHMTNPPIDPTLTVSNAAADAKVTGDEITDLKNALSCQRLFDIPNITAFEKGGWSNGVKSSFRQANRARTIAKFYCLDTVSISLKNQGTPLIYIEKYDSVGTRTEVITWTTQAIINKGDIVTITLTMGNTGDATETPLEDIFNAFSFLSVTPVVADTADLTFGQGLISMANAISAWYKTRIYANEYIPVPDKLIYFSIETGYRAYIVTYDDSFNIIDYGVGGWLTGNIWKDLNGARYYRVMVSKANDAEILPTEAVALTIKTFPSVKSETLIAISKDGINDSGKAYAPSYPKSSIISFEKAIIQGFNAIELHVQMTTDGIPVVLHQQNINGVARNPDGTEISQTVSVSGSTLEQLNQYDFGILYGQKYAGTKILTLEQALKFCKDKGVYTFIEPVTTLTEENETIVCNLLKKYGMQNQCGYFAYDGPVLVRIKNKIPTAMLYLWRNNDAQMSSGISYVTANLKTTENRVFYYTYAETEVAEETIQNMASANIELMLQHLSDEEPVNIETTGNIYSSARVTQIVPATAVLGLI